MSVIAISLPVVALVAISSVVCSAVVVFLFGARRAGDSRGAAGFDLLDDDVVLLCDGDGLIGASPGARAVLGPIVPGESDHARLARIFAEDFPAIEEILATEDDFVERDIPGEQSPKVMRASRIGGITRICILVPAESDPGVRIFASHLNEMETELETLRAIAANTPVLVWRQDPSGAINWANRAYLDQAARVFRDQSDVWPPPHLFDREALNQSGGQDKPRRIAAAHGDTAGPAWHEVHRTPMGSDTLFTAIDIGTTVHAEQQLREFTQVLTKTFAHLKIGLAVFDRSRRLALFNPALGDLTALPASFLAERPSLMGFLDRLRDLHMIPEPKNYKSWRRQLAELEAAAMDGSYSEVWSLPSGQTYRVTGRPHPGGGMAFLFEDISSEVSLTRRFRSELEMGQAVADSMDEAIAVFSQDGTLSMTNSRYEQLWFGDRQGPLERHSIVEATRIWMSLCAPNPVWGDIRDFASQLRDREEFAARVNMANGRILTCRVVPLSGGLTLIGFRDAQGTESGPVKSVKTA